MRVIRPLIISKGSEERERPNAEEQAHRQKVKMDVRAMDCGWGLGVSFRFAMIISENPIC